MIKHGWKWERAAALLSLIILLTLTLASVAQAASWHETYAPDGWSWGDDPQ